MKEEMHLVLEIPAAGKNHRHAFLVGGGNRVFVSDAPARLDGRSRTCVCGGNQAIRKGKNASEATEGTFEERLASPAFQTAIRELSTRDICPAPTPKVRSSPA